MCLGQFGVAVEPAGMYKEEEEEEMLRTGLVADSRYLQHETPPGHPERPDRLRVLLDMIEARERKGLVRLDPRVAKREEIIRVHKPTHYDLVAETAGASHFAFDADTYTSPGSFDAALLSAGGLLAIVEAIMAGDIDNGFGLVRPPGHHAEWNRAMGFCLFNNVAIAARLLLEEHGIERILIVDWDVHHGNGTQRTFYTDPRVLYVSTHQYPFYPGTGDVGEVGSGDGLGFTVNIPLRAGGGDREYIAAFRQIIAPICRQFDPRFVLVSAGFDAHMLDPLANMNVTDEGFASMARILLDVAGEHANGRFAAVLEGGYDLDALRRSVDRVLEEMGKESPAGELPTAASDIDVISRVEAVQRQYWNL